MIKSVGEIAVSLQHKQKLSMSISILQRLGLYLISRGEHKSARDKLLECLECHFRTVNVHEKIDQIIMNEPEVMFYQNHSWAGCLSIFVVASLASTLCELPQAVMLCKLAAYAISSLFSNFVSAPSKQIDFILFEPVEIIPGIDNFSSIDSNHPFINPISSEYMVPAIENLLMSMSSFEQNFEIFKPLAFARHYYRFIIREKRYLTRARLVTAIACSKFGLLNQGFSILSDVISQFGLPSITKEFSNSICPYKRLLFDSTEPGSSLQNVETLKSFSQSSLIGTIASFYGSTISAHYVICVSSFLICISESFDSSSETFDTSQTKNSLQSSRSKHRKPHHMKKDSETQELQPSNYEVPEMCLKSADAMILDFIGKNSKYYSNEVKLELMLSQVDIKMHQWQWDQAISIGLEIMKVKNT